MRKVYKAVFLLYLIITSILCLAVFAGTYFTGIIDNAYKWFKNTVTANIPARIGFSAVFAIIVIFSIFIMCELLKRNRPKKSVGKKTESGEIHISLESIENISLLSIEDVEGIVNTYAKVVKINDTVNIIITINVYPEVNIPEVSYEIQKKVKFSVEELSGIPVNNVRVLVNSINMEKIKREK